jgi:hypothetical protein
MDIYGNDLKKNSMIVQKDSVHCIVFNGKSAS